MDTDVPAFEVDTALLVCMVYLDGFPDVKRFPIFFFLTRDAFNLAHKGLVVVEIQVYQVYRIRTHRLSSVLSLFQPTIDILSVETLYAFLLRYD